MKMKMKTKMKKKGKGKRGKIKKGRNSKILQNIEKNEENNTNILFLSSFVFITNICTAFYNRYYIYSLLFTMLTATSLIYHTNKNMYTKSIDQTCVFFVIAYGCYMVYNKTNADKHIILSLIIASFLLCIYLYIYGYCKQTYCFHSQKNIADQYHCLLHYIASFGHHFIIFM